MDMESATVIGGGGTKLHVRDVGRRDGPPILFVHGWSQHHLAFRRQFESPLAEEFRLVALDLRGHGMSDVPADVAAYTSEETWAADIAAVIEQRGLTRPVIVAWSYGGYVVSDYLDRHGDGHVAGINYAGWSVVVGEPVPRFVGRGFHDFHAGAISEDMPTEIAAMRGFVHACFGGPIPQEDLETILAFNVMTPRFVRYALTQKPHKDYAPVLAKLEVPVLISHGTAETVALPSAADYALRSYPTATVSWYEGAGHAPFVEDPGRFNRELADFTRAAQKKRSAP
jgi:pimeloyl-ACP methyl ester carboxylesterase